MTTRPRTRRLISTGALVLVGLALVPAAPAAATHRPSWTIVPSPNPLPPPASQSLNGASCTSTSFCMAVGQTTTPSSLGPLIERWDGSSWSISSSPAVSNLTLESVSCVSATACFAVGFTGGGGSSVIERWDGTSWSVSAQPPMTALWGVSCPAADACFAVGVRFAGFFALAPVVEQWNGGSWSEVASPSVGSESGFQSVSCTSSASCFAVGSSGAHFAPSSPLIERWNGSTWSVTPNPSPGSNAAMVSVTCADPSSCFALGMVGSRARSYVENWDGSAWSVGQVFPWPSRQLAAVSCGAIGLCVAVGSAIGTAEDTTLTRRRTGAGWVMTKSANPPGAKSSALNGASCVGSTFCVAVGRSDSNTLVERFQGG